MNFGYDKYDEVWIKCINSMHAEKVVRSASYVFESTLNDFDYISYRAHELLSSQMDFIALHSNDFTNIPDRNETEETYSTHTL
jgi:hypothetical protein